jgi:hypothetical protein
MSPRGGVRHLGAAVPATIRLGSYTQRIVETRQASVPRPPERDATVPGHATLVWAVSCIAYECALESRLVRFSDLPRSGTRGLPWVSKRQTLPALHPTK